MLEKWNIVGEECILAVFNLKKVFILRIGLELRRIKFIRCLNFTEG